MPWQLNNGSRNRQNPEVNLMFIHDRDAPVTRILESLQVDLRNSRADVLVGFSEIVDELGIEEVLFQSDFCQVFRRGLFRDQTSENGAAKAFVEAIAAAVIVTRLSRLLRVVICTFAL